MESIIARALEYTLKYWLKSFSRDQFKLQGRTAQLSNLDINGDALHASIGLPPAISVTTAKVGKLEIVPLLSLCMLSFGFLFDPASTRASPMASITIHNLLLYTTNENWQVVNLKEARDFSSDKKQIFVFKKLEWESLSIDLLPHPDMFYMQCI
ncbi:hypothetical protein Leryth_024694 [Lithospermum erythrorhizon]|nr:hypothetical protein Leryth_024694 [Lithospermum erythrorhizon]